MSETKLYTWEEIAKHKSEESCWIVIRGNVVNVTDWLPIHPGGVDTIQQMAGRDATNMFEAIQAHFAAERADKEWKKRIIGKVDPDSKPPVPPKLSGPRKDQKPIRYGMSMHPMYFWLIVIAVFILIIWFAL